MSICILTTLSNSLKVHLAVRLIPRLSIVSRFSGASKFYSAMSDAYSDLRLAEFLRQSYPSIIPSTTSDWQIPNYYWAIFPKTSYTEDEATEVTQWLITSYRIVELGEDKAKQAEILDSVNGHLSSRTTLLGIKPSIADIALFFRLIPVVKQWSSQERTGEHGHRHIVRYVDFVQNAPLFGLPSSSAEKINIDVDDVKFVPKLIDPKEEKERKKKKAAAAGPNANGQKSLVVDRTKEQDGDLKLQKDSETLKDSLSPAALASQPQSSKKEKKEKVPKAPKTPAETPSLSPSAIDLRVGHILKAVPHPNADSLYVSTVACGDSPDSPNTSMHENQVVRTVCSGLNGLIPLSEMQNRKIVAVCNLKPVTMRGIKSAAMVLAASPRAAPGEESAHGGPIELVQVPDGAVAGERIFFEGWEEGQPEAVLNPKKKVWETLQPGFVTTNEFEVAFDPEAVEGLKGSASGKGIGKLRTKGGYCTVSSLKGATVR